ncbi:unnamed protein product [Bemisia tabaci]|uniref:Uncharacterized protein n=1 Tax=Bemisia tabaci TaxID=7038 RepID=A0A9P0F8M9_BEMTA|nr:unnamed protein product [Bemisia tabaci]
MTPEMRVLLAHLALLCVLPVKWIEGATSAAHPTECNVCDCREGILDCSVTSSDTFNIVLRLPLRNYTEANFMLNHIEKVETDFPLAYWRTLRLNENRIAEIKVGAFANLPLLEMLDLSHNLLTSDKLKPHVFKGMYMANEYQPMHNLRVLRLGHNDLHTLHPDVFEHLPNLESLILESNPLKHIDKPTIIALSSIFSLHTLDLSNTGISEIPERMLHTPRNLSTINLSRNNFTSVPEGLGDSHALKHLILDSNPIEVVRSFPALPKLEVLHISWMPLLKKIEKGGLNGLPALQELHCSHNDRLVEIDKAALSTPTIGEEQSETWPPLKKLILDNNRLRYLDQEFLDQWDKLDVIDLRGNDWSCDCENQWIVTSLIPIMRKANLDTAMDIICQEPVEMLGQNMRELSSLDYHMRCLDYYNHQPEKDATLLVWIVILVVALIPLAMGLVLYYRRNFATRNIHYIRTYYKPTEQHLFT